MVKNSNKAPNGDQARERLLKPLKLELKQGCLDKAMSGGLEANVMAWVQSAAPEPGLRLKLERLARGYRALDPAARRREIEALLAYGDGRLEPEAKPAPAAPASTLSLD